MANETNGNAKSRLDRIEGILEVMVNRQAEWEDDHRRLLTSQVLLQEELRTFGAKSEARFAKIELTLAEVTDKLNGLIDLMDRHVREHGTNQ